MSLIIWLFSKNSNMNRNIVSYDILIYKSSIDFYSTIQNSEQFI